MHIYIYLLFFTIVGNPCYHKELWSKGLCCL